MAAGLALVKDATSSETLAQAATVTLLLDVGALLATDVVAVEGGLVVGADPMLLGVGQEGDHEAAGPCGV